MGLLKKGAIPSALQDAKIWNTHKYCMSCCCNGITAGCGSLVGSIPDGGGDEGEENNRMDNNGLKIMRND
jgi:hypothetical protein